MLRRPPRSTRTDTLFPYTTRFRSPVRGDLRELDGFQVSVPDRQYRNHLQPGVGGPEGRPARIRSAAERARIHRRSLVRSEEHTSEIQSLMRSSYAVFCLKNKMRYEELQIKIDT